MTDADIIKLSELGSDPVAGLRRLREMREAHEKLTRQLVARSRRKGVSWQEIADALGVSRQAAWERYNTPSKQS